MPIVVLDAKCFDCKGAVTLFGIPDNVWRGLGLSKQWLCLKCVAHRLNPHIDVSQLSKELYKQRHKFRLTRVNEYLGVKMGTCAAVIAEPGDKSTAKGMTIRQIMGGQRTTPRKTKRSKKRKRQTK